MTSSFLRPAILCALVAAGVAGCGGKATFEITGNVAGLTYPGLVLTETFSGQTITLTDTTKTTFAFPNTIEYGAQYNVVVRTTPSGQPPHLQCLLDAGSTGTAGLRASIIVGVNCTPVPHAIGGKLTLTSTTGSYVGLQLINGSNNQAPFAITDVSQTVYAFPGISYNTPYGISILQQPTDKLTMCHLVPAVATTGATATQVAGVMGDVDIAIDVVCAKP